MKPVMSAKARLVLLLAFGLLITGLVSRDGRTALLALPMVFYLAAGLLAAPRAACLAVRREMGSLRAEAGRPVPMKVTVVNEGPHLPLLKIWDEMPEGLNAEDGGCTEQAALPAGGSLALHYSIRAGRGRYSWGVVHAAASDPFGLFETRMALAAAGTLHVLPARTAAKGLRLRPRQTRPTAGPHLSRRAGLGTDFFGVREYHPGDSLRRIAWRQAARHPGEFFSKEYEQEGMADIGLLLDARAVVNLEKDGGNLLDYSIQAASELAAGFLNAGDRVSLLILGRQVTRVFPGTGKRQNLAIQQALAACRPGENVSFETLRHLPVRLFPSRSTLVIVSPLVREDLAPLTRLCASGYHLVAVSPDPAAFSARQGAESGLATRAAALERRLLLWEARRSGIRVISWQVHEPFVRVLRSSMWVQP